MQMRSVEAIVRELNEADVRYLIVGGLAVVAHGYVRFTADFDVVIQLSDENLRKAGDVFKSLGYSPRLPVSFDDFCRVENRDVWVNQRNMQVFSLGSELHPQTEIDIFAKEPFDFDEAWRNADTLQVVSGLSAPVVSYEQ